MQLQIQRTNYRQRIVTIVTFKKCGSVGICLVGIPDLSFKGAFSFISPNIFTILYLCEATKN